MPKAVPRKHAPAEDRRQVGETVRGKDVADRLAALQGTRRNELEPDTTRGASSPLGMGTGSQPVKRGRRR